MPNATIQNYLKDTSIDVEKRRYVMDQIKSGTSEDELATSITKKYGEKYGSGAGIVDRRSVAERKGIGSIDIGQPKKETPAPEGPSLPPGIFTDPVGLAKEIAKRGKMGVEAGFETAKGGVKRLGEGVKDIAGAFGDEDFTEGGRSIDPETGQPSEDRDLSDRVAQFGMGLAKLGGGAGQIALTAPSAAFGTIQPELEASVKGYQEAFRLLPPDTQEQVKQSAQKLVDSVPDDVKEGAENFMYSLGLLTLPSQLKLLKQAKPVKPASQNLSSKATLNQKQINAAVEQGKISAERGKQILKAAEEAKNKGMATRPMEITGKRMNQSISDFNRKINEVGKEIGRKAQQLGGDKAQVNTKSVLKTLEKSLKEKNVSIKNGKLDFSSSDLKGLSQTGKSTLQEQYDLFRKTGANARELLANNRDLGNRLFSGSKEASFTGAEGILNKVRDTSVKVMNKQYPALKPLNAQYTEMTNVIDNISHLAGAEGVKSPQVLRRIFGQASGQSKDAVMKLENLAKKYDIKSGLNLAKEAEFALEVEQAIGVVPTSGFAGQVGTGVTGVSDIKQSAIKKAIQYLADKGFGSPKDNLVKILENPTGYTKPTIAKKVLDILEFPLETKVPPELITALRNIKADTRGGMNLESVETYLEKAGGWKPGTKAQFDRALLKKDASAVKSMLPEVPAEYKKRFAQEIKDILVKLDGNEAKDALPLIEDALK